MVIDIALAQIAQQHLDIETLETRNADRLDFHDVAVWCVRSALAAAYEAGRESTRRLDTNRNNAMIPITPTQRAVLECAIEHTDGRIDWLPDNVKGGARKKVLDALAKRGLIDTTGTVWNIADEGYHAMSCQRPALDAACAAPSTRSGTKQATVLALLQRPEGTTVAQIMAATGWQAHTV